MLAMAGLLALSCAFVTYSAVQGWQHALVHPFAALRLRSICGEEPEPGPGPAGPSGQAPALVEWTLP